MSYLSIISGEWGLVNKIPAHNAYRDKSTKKPGWGKREEKKRSARHLISSLKHFRGTHMCSIYVRFMVDNPYKNAQ